MKNQALRWPGGSGGTLIHDQRLQGWARADHFFTWPPQHRRTGVLIVNYGSGHPQQAADWVRFCNLTNHCYVKYWEVGNEVAAVGRRPQHQSPLSAPRSVDLRPAFQQLLQPDERRGPDIKIGAVADTTEDGTANYTNHPVVNPATGMTHNGWTR